MSKNVNSTNNTSNKQEHRKKLRNRTIIIAIVIAIILLLIHCSHGCGDDEATKQEYFLHLLGNAEMELELGEDYIEPGYEVRDQHGNRIAEKEEEVTVDGTVGTKVGEYELTYRFEDQTLKRYVYVVDGSGGSSEDIDSSESKEETEGSIESSETNPKETNEPTATESPNPTKKPSIPTAKPEESPEPTKKPGRPTPTPEPTNKPSIPTAKPEESPEPTEKPGRPTPTPEPKKEYDMSSVKFASATFTYDGNAHNIFISGELPKGVSVSYTGNGKVDAGTYTVTAHFNGDDKHQAIPDMTAKLTINKAVYQLSGVKFESKTFTYDGKQHSITATGIPNGVTASYVDNTRTEVGSNKATVTFGLSEVLNKNYSSISPSTLSATITIKGEEPNPTEKPSYDMSGVIFKGETFTYDGSEHSIFISGKLPTGVSVTYTGNGKVNAGTYTVTAHFNGDDKHQPIPDMTAILTINKAVFTISGVAFNSATVTYDGQQHTITPTGIPNGITVNLANNARTNAGESTATANFGLSEELSKNYSSVSPSSLTATLTILKATPDMSGVTLSGKTVTYNSRPYSLEISGSLPAGVSVSYIGNGVTEVGSYTITAVFSVADSSNWNTPSSMTATLIIEKDKNDNPDEGDKENPDDDDEDGDDNPDEGDKDNPDNNDEDDEPDSVTPSNPGGSEEDDEPDSVTPSNPGGSEEDDEPGSVIPSNPGGSEEDNNVAIAESTNFSELDGDKPGDVVQQNPDVAVEVIYSITQQREDASESEAKSLDI